MTNAQVFAYAVGHLMNDLVIQVWNSYGTWYFKEVVGLTDE